MDEKLKITFLPLYVHHELHIKHTHPVEICHQILVKSQSQRVKSLPDHFKEGIRLLEAKGSKKPHSYIGSFCSNANTALRFTVY